MKNHLDVKFPHFGEYIEHSHIGGGLPSPSDYLANRTWNQWHSVTTRPTITALYSNSTHYGYEWTSNGKFYWEW